MRDGFVGLAAGGGPDARVRLGDEAGMASVHGCSRFAVEGPAIEPQHADMAGTLVVSAPRAVPDAERVVGAFRKGDTSALTNLGIEAPMGVGFLETGRAWVISPPAGGRPIYYGVGRSVCGLLERALTVSSLR